ncbi:hypothetical protein ACN08P_19005 [Photobacterium leiognathi subsp. mandapamensis]|uniref:hypothetical protein n=1 Tax=Photobacterium leiognathi TaxID=553611 RepID=UPI003AF3E4EF
MKLSDLIAEPSYEQHIKNNKANIKRVGMSAVTFENNIYSVMDKMTGYNGASFLWTEFRSFTGLFAFGDETPVIIRGNYIEAETTFELASLLANLMLSNMMAWHYHEKGDEGLTGYYSNMYHALRNVVLDYLDENPDEQALLDILKIID